MALGRKSSRGALRGHELFPGFTDVYEIGVGSLAVVFRARELGTNRQVALKLLNVRDASPRSIESFERESIALGALSSHPNIVTLFRTFRTPDGRPVLVLELCSGAVADRLHDGTGLPVTDAVSIGIKIAGALETAHRGGILHRDVKPQNILVTEFGEPALADFGVAMLQSATQTTAGLFDFTTLHAAPELLEGSGTSAATDVYELASSLYQLVAGQSAFRAYDGESPASVILRILRDPVRPLSSAGVPPALSDLLIRAMSKEKTERPPTAAEFAAELADVEIAEGWNRTQFLIRDPGPLGIGIAPAVTRLPDDVPRGLPSTLVTAPSPLTPVGSPGAFQRPPPVSGGDARTARTAAHNAPAAPPAQPTPLTPLSRPVPAATYPTPTPSRRIAPAAPPARGDAAWTAPTVVPGVGGWTPPPVAAPPAQSPGQSPGQSPPVRLEDPDLARPEPGAVPVWAVRAPTAMQAGPPSSPQFSSDLSLDPMSLRRKATLRSGASSVLVDEQKLRVRTWFRHTEIPWTQVLGFEAHLDRPDTGAALGPAAPASGGQIVALTSTGPVELLGTRRGPAELRYIHALLEAYRIRAQRLANG